MSIIDDINRLRQLAASPSHVPIEQIREIQSIIIGTNAEVAEILGNDHGFYHGIGAVGASVSASLDEAIAKLEEYESAIHDAADLLEFGASG